MSVMDYKAVVRNVANKTGYSDEQVKEILDGGVETLVRGVVSGKTVQIENLGSFYLKFLSRRSIPQHIISGEEAVSESHIKITFKEYMPVKRRIVKKYGKFIERWREEHGDDDN